MANTETTSKKLTVKERKFVDKYLETGNATKAYKEAGYKVSTTQMAATEACAMIKKPHIAEEIGLRQEKATKESIATAQEVMEYFTKVMKGEIQDQFGLEAPLAERTRAAVELAKRTIDIENRINGRPDNVVKIKLDWGEDE